MPKKLLALIAAAAVSGGAWTAYAAAADDPPPPPSERTLVGIMVDSKDGLTESTINCGRDGKHWTTDGDGTLFMPNLYPHKVTCTITIRRVAQSA